MPNKKKNIILSIIGVTLILLMLIGATYAYFQAQIKDGASSEVAIDTDTVDILTFKASNDIVFEATQENFGREEGNISGTTILNAHLIANNTNQTASYKYNVYLDITKNNFVYSKDNKTPEIVLVIKNPSDQYVTTTNSKIGNKTTVDLNGEQVTGYDITTKIGLVEISLDYLISATPSTNGIADQNWKISVVLVNLDSNQVANAGKSFKAKAKVQSERINVLNLGIQYDYYRVSKYRNKIKNVYFVNYINEEELNSVAKWDLSSVKDKSIMGWLKEENEDETAPYNLYIGSNLKEGEKIIVRSFAYAFNYMTNLETVDLNLDILDTSNLNDTSNMFASTSKLTTITGIEDLDVSNVTNMQSIFSNASGLTGLDISKWNTQNVMNMSNMFRNASSLTTIGDISGWDTSQVTNMSGMFESYKGTEIKGIENLKVSNVTDMSYMFSGASGLTELDLSNWKTSNVTNMSNMFARTNLTTLNLNNWDTSNVSDMSSMFYGLSGLTTLDISNWDTCSVTNMLDMFAGPNRGVYGTKNSIKSIIGAEILDTSNVTNMEGMFAGTILTTLNLSNWDTHNVENMSMMFKKNDYLTTIGDIRDWDTTNVTNMSEMFYYASGLTELDLSNWDTSNVIDMSGMFFYASGLTELDLSNWDTLNVIDMSGMFNGTKLTRLDLSGWDTSNVTNMSGMFESVNSSIIPDISKWNTSKVENMSGLFSRTSYNYDVSKIDTHSVTNMSYMFNGYRGSTITGIKDLNVSNVTNMSYMFQDARELITLDLSNWYTTNVTNMLLMFYGTSSLTSIDMRRATFSQVTSYNNMFFSTNSALKVTITGDVNKGWFIDNSVLSEDKLNVLKD